MKKRILILGGSGFVGSSLAFQFKESFQGAKIVVFDNLHRRGSELNIPKFKKLDIEFTHGDIRNSADLDDLEGDFDLIIEASAEPSVHAGTSGKGISYLASTNLLGTLNFLEFARKRQVPSIFLSTSRVYSIEALRNLHLKTENDRLVPSKQNDQQGFTADGIDERFPMTGHGFRSLYGTTKLASELFIEEYATTFKLPILINRCGVLAGPGQFGKTDQGVFTLWVARHLFGGPLSYTGFGGEGHQVRDLLHTTDLFRLMALQIPLIEKYKGKVFAVGGGLAGSVSLKEYTKICSDLSGNSLNITSVPSTADVDVPWYVTNTQLASDTFGWRPHITPEKIAEDIFVWLKKDSSILRPLFT